jgi:hypothetical protein
MPALGPRRKREFFKAADRLYDPARPPDPTLM